MTAIWNRVNTIILLLVLFALLAVIAMLATGVRGGPLDPPEPPGSTASVKLPGTPISGQTTITQPGHYYLTNDINVSGAVNAITIGASNVSLDLGGFTIGGTDTPGSTGIVATSTFSVRIENGTVQDFHVGVNTGPAERSRIVDVQAVSNIRNFEIGARTVLTDCQSIGSTESGIVVLGTRSIVSDCLVLDSDVDGIAIAGSRAHIHGNTIWSDIDDSDIKLVASGSSATIRENKFFRLEVGSGFNVVVDNVCESKTAGVFHIYVTAALAQYIASDTDPPCELWLQCRISPIGRARTPETMCRPMIRKPCVTPTVAR